MKYKLLKDIPGIKAGTYMKSRGNENLLAYDANTLEVNSEFASANPDFFEPIVEKKKFEDLVSGDTILIIGVNGTVDMCGFHCNNVKYETFLTEHDAEMERLRREARANVYLPKVGESVWVWYPGAAMNHCFDSREAYTYDYFFGNIHKTEQDAKEYGRKYAKAFEIPNE